MLPDEPTDEERQQQLPEDNQTPFRPADPAPDPTGGVTNDPAAQASSDGQLDDTHPVTDTNVQPEEQYDAGVAGAAGAQEPNAGNTVTGYTPPAGQPGQTVSPGNTGGTGDNANGDDTTVAADQPDVGPTEQPPA